jgi:hypothetical protein
VGKVCLIVFTNGDHLDEEVMDYVLGPGVKLHVDIYPPEGDEFNEEKIAAAIKKFEKRTQYSVAYKTNSQSGWDAYVITDTGNRAVSSLKVGKYTKENIYTRGDAMNVRTRNTHQRTVVCLTSIYHMNVNFDGKEMLFCHTRTDFDGHKDATIVEIL